MISKNVKSISRLAEELVEIDSSDYGNAFFHGDDNAARNMIIDVLGESSTKGDFNKSTREEDEYVRQRENERDSAYHEVYGMDYEDYLAYEEQEIPYYLKKYSNFDEQKYYDLHADEIMDSLDRRDAELNNKENGQQGNVSTGENERNDRGSEILPKQGSDDEGGSKNAAIEGRSTHTGLQGDAEKGPVSKETSSAEVNGIRLSEDEADILISNMEANADVAPDLELTPENWNEQFGEDGMVSTPIGNVKMGENQLAKLFLKGRNSQFGMIRPTLTNPDVIIEENSEAANGDETERNSSYLFIKTFIENDKKIRYFASITVSQNGLEVVISNHIMNKNSVCRKLQGGFIRYTKKTLLSNSSELHLAEHQNDVPDLLPTQDSTVSADKDTQNSESQNINDKNL